MNLIEKPLTASVIIPRSNTSSNIFRYNEPQVTQSKVNALRLSSLNSARLVNKRQNSSSVEASSATSLSNFDTGSPNLQRFFKMPNTLQSSLVQTSRGSLYKLYLQTARYFASTLSPFTHIEDSQFVKLWEMLRPGTKPPNRHQLANELVDEVYNEQRGLILSQVEGRRATLSLDGWSTITNNPVIGVAFTLREGASYFIKAIDTTNLPHTSEQLVQWAIEAMRMVENESHVKIISVVTDGAPNMVKMRNTIEDQIRGNQYRPIYIYGYQAHLLNLISKELDKDFNKCTDKISLIICL